MLESKFYFLVRSWNMYECFDRCIDSIFSQKFKQYSILFVDDASEYTKGQKEHIRKRLKTHLVVFKKRRSYSLKNAHDIIHKYVNEDSAVIINVDCDDWLIGNQVINIVKYIYEKENCLLTYGSCMLYTLKSDNLRPSLDLGKQVNKRYPSKIEQNNSYRLQPFYPLHLRTWRAGIFKKIKKKSFLKPDNTWIRFCEDIAMFLPMLEMTNGNYKVITKPLYVYNMRNPYNSKKVNALDRLYEETWIRKQKPYAPLYEKSK